MTFWFATSESVSLELVLYPDSEEALPVDLQVLDKGHQRFCAATSLYFHLLVVDLNESLPTERWIGYDLLLIPEGSNERKNWQDWAPHLAYEGRELPGFVLTSSIRRVMHGSCRKPHHPSGDGLVRADSWLSSHEISEWPSVLIMSGDQIYTDDVSTPMLVAIHRLIRLLGFPSESFSEARLSNSQQLHDTEPLYADRQNLLPALNDDTSLGQVLFTGTRKPVFTSINAQNHLVSLAEILAMYLLVWSPACWQLIDMQMPQGLDKKGIDKKSFESEKQIIETFKQQLHRAQRVMAHLPCAMIFDDHDVTDDWNLTAAWEQAAYGHPFSKRIIGNALLGYFICQGWGNAPEHFTEEMITTTQEVLLKPGTHTHDELIDTLLRFPNWHYHWQTSPEIVVLDTRTHRWRSEKNLNKPSGLMDWEMLAELQQKLIGKDAVILVSPAPMFGVKLIEVIQRVFTWFGKPLMVDAENWMAHPGAANVLLNLFRHTKTPKHFVILSGDVHYSFVYSIEWRGQKSAADIWQITSSGIKNEFPKNLLEILDRANRWLYSPRSPLN
ncbi:MAG: alkaline phosphatase D family protein, partial [Kangiellaceae bacterium]|nr:alkaline phosphatase D family protein [Kangiellaceae bacterium]